LSIRSFVRLGSSLTVASTGLLAAGTGSGTSNTLSIGSESSGSYLNMLGGSLSVADSCHLASGLSLRSFARLGSTLSLYLPSGHNSVKTVSGIHIQVDSTPELLFYETSATSGNSIMTLKAGSSDARGTLHGTWISSSVSSVTSDRRLKQDIVPLMQGLTYELGGSGMFGEQRQQFVHHELGSHEGVTLSPRSLLHALRPVSFRYKSSVESKFSHFGFIAQDLERVLPGLVTDVTGNTRSSVGGQQNQNAEQRSLLSKDEGSPERAIRQNDLLAVLTLVLQDMDSRSGTEETGLTARARALEARVDEDYALLEPQVAALEDSLLRGLLDEIVLPRLAEGRRNAIANINATASSHVEVAAPALESSSAGNAAADDGAVEEITSEDGDEHGDTFFARLKETLRSKESATAEEKRAIESAASLDDLLENLGEFEDETLAEIERLLEELDQEDGDSDANHLVEEVETF
jgi:hypothetical protein